MFKSFKFMLLAALTMVCGNLFAQEETTVTWESSSGDALTTIYPDANISLKWEEGGGDFGAKYVNGSVYFYNGNRVIVSGVSTDVTIKKIVFTFSSGSVSMVTCNASGKNESSYGITNSSADMTSTWEGETNSLIFRAPKQTGVRYISSIAVTYTGGTTGPVVTAPKLNIETTSWNDTYDMDANGVFVVYAKNEGNAAAENAKVTVYLDGAENTAWEIGTLAIGADNVWKNMKYNLEGIEAGKHQVKLALTADNADAFEVEKEVTFTKAAAQAAFSISATNVTVAYDATSFNVVATVTNTSEVDATNVVVKLQKDITNAVAEATIESLAAGETKDVTLTVENGPFDAGQKTYYLYVNNKYLNDVVVTVEEAPVGDQIDMAITAIQGANQIDLNGTNTYKVWYKNEGNVKMENVDIILLVNDNEAGRQDVTVEAGEQGSVDFTLNVADLFEESEDLNTEATLIAMVNVDGDVDATNNQSQMTATVVKTVAEATFEVTAQPVQVQLPAEKFNVVATVKNTSEIAAENVEVKLFYNTVIATQKIEALAAGAETTVTFADVQNPFTTAGEYSMWVQAPKTNAEVKVTVLAEVEDEKIDMAITAIQGISEVSLKGDNKATVWYENKGNVAVTTNIVLLVNDNEAGVQEVTCEAGRNGFVEFTFDANDFVEPTEDTEATLIAMVNAENDVDASNNRVTKTLPVVSGEVAPAAEIAINPISSFEVEAGEQTVSVVVTVFNNGEVEAKNVKVELYKSYGDGLCEAQIVDVPAGEENWKMLTFTFTYNFEEGKDYEFTAFTNYADANSENQMQKFTITCTAPKADVSVAKIAPIAATTEEDVVIAATLTNNSTVTAQNVKVGVYTLENLQYQLVGIQQTVEEIAAGEQANVEFNLGKLEAGEYTYYVLINEDANIDNNSQDVTVKVTEPEQETIDMAIQAIQGSAEINLKGENTYKVWYKNEGNVTVENADIILLVDGENEAGRQAVTVEPGKNGMVEITLDLADFDPVEDLDREVILMGYVNVDGDVNAENNKSQMTATVVSKDEVVEPQFTITAQPVEVEFGAEKFDVTATIAADIAAENVEVQLFYNQTIATQAVNVTTEATTVTFADVENPFTKAGEYTMYVLAGKAAAEVKVTVQPEAVDETIDMAVTAIQGLSQIDLTKENKATVWYENKGTKDMENVTIIFSVNDDVQEAQVDVAAGKNGYVEFTLDTTNILPEDEDAEVVAWVNVDGDVDTTNDKVTKVVPVINGEAPVATFAVTADNVTVPFGAESFDIVATVANTGDINGAVTVKLLKGIETVATEYKEIAAGKDAVVTFTIEAPEGGFEAGKAMYYVQAGTSQANVEVTFEAEPVEGTIDMAVIAIQGLSKINLKAENKATVWYENKGTKDMENVVVMFSVNDHAMEQNVNVQAGKNGYVEFTIPADIFEPAEDVEAELIAWVNVEGDIDNTNDKVTRTVPVVNGEPALSFTVEEVTALKDAASFNVKVTVANTGNGAAKNVAVKVYDENSAELGVATIATIAAGAEQTATITVNKTYTEVGTFRNQLQVYVAGVEGVKWVSVNVTDDPTAVGIAAIKAKYGENVVVYTLTGRKVNVNDIRKRNVYIINGKKAVIK